MPPKSASKTTPKASKLQWIECDKCALTVLAQDHQKNCGKSLPAFIQQKKFFATKVEPKIPAEEDKLLTEGQLSNLVHVNTQVLKQCGLVIGDYIMVEVPGRLIRVKRIWPSDGKIEVISLASSEVEVFTLEPNERICVSKMFAPIFSALEVRLKYSGDEPPDERCTEKLLSLLKSQLTNHVYKAGDKVSLNFLNKTFRFTIEEILEAFSDDLAVQMIHLSLKEEQFYQFTCNTSFKLIRQADLATSITNNLPVIGGLDKEMNEIEEHITSLSRNSGEPTTRAVLLFGPSGCGKSLLTRVLIHKLGIASVRVNASEILRKVYGETEANLNEHFEKAAKNYPCPTLLVFEDIQNICPKTDSSDVVRRASASFLSLLDGLYQKRGFQRIFLLATTNHPDSIDPAFRRSGRFEYEIEIAVPNAEEREKILEAILCQLSHEIQPSELKELALITHGFTGADLASLISKANHNKGQSLLHFEMVKETLVHVKPSAMREVLIETPNVRWADIGGQEELKLKLQQAIEWPIRHPETFKRLGIAPPRGLLMFGPPGCSKTMIAKALATESGINFLSIRGSELFSMWVGESEKAVKELFRKARQVAPSIVFFDEIDAIGGERGAEGGSSSVKERVLAQILTEMDGVTALNSVTIVAATNRPDLIDKALMRPGRLDRIIYVDLPDAATRREIFRIKLKKMPVHSDVDLESLVTRTEGYSGAEIQAVCQEAALFALEQSFEASEVRKEDFDFALAAVVPRTSEDLLDLYKNYLAKFLHK